MGRLQLIIEEFKRDALDTDELVDWTVEWLRDEAEDALERCKRYMPLQKKSGRLHRGLYTETRGGKTFVEVEFGTRDVPYASLHEYGGTVRPKRRPFLLVPGFDNPDKVRYGKIDKSIMQFRESNATPGNVVVLLGHGWGWLPHMFTLARKAEYEPRMGFRDYFDRWWAFLTVH